MGPSQRPWQAVLLGSVDGRSEAVCEGPVAADGTWSCAKASYERKYQLRLRSASGDVWYTDPESFVFDEAHRQRRIEVGIEPVRGRVTLGRTSLSAQVTFGTAHGAESIVLKANEEGLFEGLLPRIGRWRIGVSADVPRVVRVVEIDVGHLESASETNAEIALPVAGVSGEVVDERGEPAGRGFVALVRRRSQEVIQERFEGGPFRLAGLVEGEYDVQASGRTFESERILLTVGRDHIEPDFLRIVVRKHVTWKGRVVSGDGRSVIGARLFASAAAPPPAELETPRLVTDADGRFEIPVRETISEICLIVAPNGFATRLARLASRPDEHVLPVQQAGGSLVLEIPSGPRTEPRFHLLFQNGCATPPEFFRLAERRTVNGRHRFSIQNMEAGSYSLCAVSPAELESYKSGEPTFPQCQRGVLAPLGALELKLP